jgi:hypothetical protein
MIMAINVDRDRDVSTGSDYHEQGVREGEGSEGKPGHVSTPPPDDSTPPPPAPDTPPPYVSSDNFSLDLPYLGNFSPELILQYVQTRLADFDGQIADIMGDAKDKKARSEQLRQFENAVRSLVGVGGDGSRYNTTTKGTNQSDENAKAGARLDAAMQALKDNPTLVGKLQTLKNQIFYGEHSSEINAEQLQTELDWAKNELTSLNSENELSMMRLNQLVQTRSQIISSSSNMLASINESTKTVIGNMRA